MFPRVKVALVIPAAGSGERLGRGIPKALVDVGGVPLLRRTLDRLGAAAEFVETVVLAPADALSAFEAAVAGALPALGCVRVLPGGATRQMSVAAGVAALGADVELVCVHDAARPLVAPETVRRALQSAQGSGAVTVASRPSDSVRQDATDGGSSALDRSRLWLVETPQIFARDLLARAHSEAAARGESYTDDATLVESIGQQIQIVESTGRNLKVTVEADLRLALEHLRG